MNFIIQVSNCGSRKSVSMDLVLFRLLESYFLSNYDAKAFIKECVLDNWGCSGLSRIVQHEILKLVCSSLLVERVFNTKNPLLLDSRSG